MTMSVKRWIEKVIGPLDQKREYRSYLARIRALPEPYRQTAAALQRYFNHTAATVLDVEGSMRMWSDFADLWEEAAADGTAIGDIVGEDPVEFAETFAQAYTGKRWVDRERRLLNEAVARAQREQREQRR
ncbi:DUF1048 domain-containing protein [Acidipropionibacterium jensenii]|uniref:DUF1048 domain-containing protein n=2 Tax=Acidipropionibacterium jensenii TaxID=1749 RepID=A0A3Q9UI74_9ACTN|nr:DUF1048 domain-containing protein [Acidipropionibacterium jensenii]AZZ42174.1 DUF1048 domain-containing protein [Acidipropionibacterium jensenii]